MGQQEQSLLDLLGKANNLHEPKPAWNEPTVLIATLSAFWGLALVCVLLRLCTRFRVVKSPGWDDLFVFLTLVSGTVGTTCICLATQTGFGQHFILLSITEMGHYMVLFYVANASYALSTTLVKLALLFQYLRMFKEKPVRPFCILITAITALWGTAYTFMAFFPCFPPHAYWDLSFSTEGSCYGYGSTDPDGFYATYSSASYSNMFLDIIILTIPVHLYFKSGTGLKEKLGLLGLLTMGGIANGLAIWRVVTIVEHKAATYPTLDPTWYGPISILLASLEIDVAIICASVPVFWPVLTSSLDRIFITREIKIERNHRFSSIDENHDSSSSFERLHKITSLDELEAGARPTSVLTAWGTFCAEHSLENLELKEVKPAYLNDHYKDSYVIAQVDPLSDVGKVESSIISEGPLKSKKVKKYPAFGQRSDGS